MKHLQPKYTQRHCRLKHNGDINIELIEKGSKTGVYVRLFIPGCSSNSVDKEATGDAAEALPVSSSSNGQQNGSDGKEVPSIVEGGHPNSTVGTVEVGEVGKEKVRPLQQNQLIQLLNQKPKHFECGQCPFSSPCRAQLEQHHSKQHPKTTVESNPNQSGIIDLDQLDLEDEAICASRLENQTPLAPSSSRPKTDQPPPKLTTAERQLNRIRDIRLKSRQDEIHLPPLADSKSAQSRNKVSSAERCPHCPYKANTSEKLQNHMQYHVCVSSVENLVNCDHCDYSVADDRALRDHIRLHFDDGTTDDDDGDSELDQQPSTVTTRSRSAKVTFFTRYDNLVLSTSGSAGTSTGPGTSKNNNNHHKHNNLNIHNLNDECILFPLKQIAHQTAESLSESASSDKENKIIVDIRTGEVLSTEQP